MSFGNFAYLAYMTIFLLGPLAAVWFVHRKTLAKYKPVLKKVLLFAVIIYLLWDNLAIYLGAWGYSPEKNIGIYIFLSPIETLFFSIGVGLAIAFTTIIFYDDSRKATL